MIASECFTVYVQLDATTGCFNSSAAGNCRHRCYQSSQCHDHNIVHKALKQHGQKFVAGQPIHCCCICRNIWLPSLRKLQPYSRAWQSLTVGHRACCLGLLLTFRTRSSQRLLQVNVVPTLDQCSQSKMLYAAPDMISGRTPERFVCKACVRSVRLLVFNCH